MTHESLRSGLRIIIRKQRVVILRKIWDCICHLLRRNNIIFCDRLERKFEFHKDILKFQRVKVDREIARRSVTRYSMKIEAVRIRRLCRESVSRNDASKKIRLL